MDSHYSNSPLLYFDDSRLRLSMLGRVMVRSIPVVASLTFTVLSLALLLSGVRWEMALGAVILIVIIDKFLHRNAPDVLLREIDGRKEKINVARSLSPAAYATVEKAYERAIMLGGSFEQELLFQLIRRHTIRRLFDRLDVSYKEFRQATDDLHRSQPQPLAKNDPAVLQKKIEKITVTAFTQARAVKRSSVGQENIFCALIEGEDIQVQKLFDTFSLSVSLVQTSLLFSILPPPQRRRSLFSATRQHKVVNRAWTSRPTHTLDSYGTDLTDLSREDGRGMLFGHEREYVQLHDSLSREQKAGVLLVGDAGSGKQTLVEHLAHQILRDRVHSRLFDKRLVLLQVGSLEAGASREKITGAVKEIVSEIETAGNIILFIPDFHLLLGSAGEGLASAAEVLLPRIAEGTFPVIAATYPAQYESIVEPRTDILGNFETVLVQEITDSQAQEFIVCQALGLEREYKVRVTVAAVREAVRVAKHYLHHKLLPGGALEILKEAVERCVRTKQRRVGALEVQEAAQEHTDIPVRGADSNEAENLLNLEDRIHEQFVDQEEAVRSIAQALREYRSGLSRTTGPASSFLFVGPTGVGKTELAKTLARVHFGSEKAMIRLDMSEYQDKESIERLLGAHNRQSTGILTEAVIKHPYSLVLLDEFEKAHPDLFNIFLQVFDDGRLTDSSGRVVDFTNTILIATSNAKSDIVREALSQGQPVASVEEYLKSKLTDVFRPELLNRFSRIIVFKDLSIRDLAKIASLNLESLVEQLREQSITLKAEDKALEQIAKLAFDPLYGARPLRQVIEDRVRSPLSEKILRKEIGPGSTITLSLEEASLVLKGE